MATFTLEEKLGSTQQGIWRKPYQLHLLFFPSQGKASGLTAAATAKSLQSCPTLCDLIDGSPPSSTILGILQARTLKWVAVSFSNAWKWKVKVKSLSCVRPLVPHGLQPTRLFCPWDFPGKSTGVGCHCLLREMIIYNNRMFWLQQCLWFSPILYWGHGEKSFWSYNFH